MDEKLGLGGSNSGDSSVARVKWPRTLRLRNFEVTFQGDCGRRGESGIIGDDVWGIGRADKLEPRE